MSKTLDEICGILLVRYDPDEIVDLLEISTEEILEKFDFKIAERYDKLNEDLEDE